MSQASPTITLLTDFGLRDPYVGVMKGVILAIRPGATIVDVTHAVAPQQVVAGNFALRGAWRYFAPGTIHVVVVDPGVGSDRRILAARSAGHVFLAPDNGILTGVLAADSEIRAVTNAQLFRPGTVSRTFHGRDIFAAVAAHLAGGTAFESVGDRAANPVRLDLPVPVVRPDGTIAAAIVHIDSFGNLITNAGADLLTADKAGRKVARIEMLGFTLDPPRESYSAVALGRPLAIVDSFDFLEIAVRGGSAAAHFNAGVGDEVRIRFD